MRQRHHFTFWWLVFIGIAGLGLYAVLARFLQGLGQTTAMSDKYPWGLWIGFDVLCGVGLSAGGFTIAALIYVFRLEKYRPILRASVLTAFLGYLMVIVSLLCDLGLPYRIWHPLIMGNFHSPLFEVAMCVMLYTGVLALEFSPALFERLGLTRPLRWVHMIALPLVILGILLSTLHQSSLGTLFLIVPNKLHGLWYSPLLPVFFYVSAIGAGLSMVIFESYMSHRAFGTGLHRDILEGLAKASGAVLLFSLTIRLADLAMQGKIALALEGSLESRMFLLEIVLGSLLPACLYFTRAVRRNRTGMYLTAVMVLCGFILNRLNVSLTGVQRYIGQPYFPSWTEITITLFITACGFAAFGIIARLLPVFPSAEGTEGEGVAFAPLQSLRPILRRHESPIATPAAFAFLSGLTMIFGVTAIFAQANSVARSVGHPSQSDSLRAREVSLRMENASLRVPSNEPLSRGAMSPGQVVFRHTTHVTGQHKACETCHAELFSMSHPASMGDRHTIEMMDRCRSCHNGETAFEIRQGCSFCHAQKPAKTMTAVTTRQIEPPPDFRYKKPASPGPVPFSHRAHLTRENGECTRCHPAIFGMVSPRNSRINMAQMQQGKGCGYCHNGQDAFTVAADCALCHRAVSQKVRRVRVARANPIPADRILTASRSPGAVTFSHRSHLSRGEKCLKCHPTVFSMSPASRLQMSSMKRGLQCGYCHNGQDAFTVAADCALCHAPPAKEAPRAVAASNGKVLPAEYKFPVGKDSPGAVLFSHAKHFEHAEKGCADCHNDLFPMRPPDNTVLTMEKMGQGQQCGACHTGKKAFALGDDCFRCHAK